jgi:DNA-binding NarL/FixJ family response regulator
MTTIVIAEGQHLVRQGLRALLSGQADLETVGEATDGLEAVCLVETLRPDVLLVDVMIGGINGLEVARQVSKRCPRTATIVLSMYDNESYVAEAFRGGARGFLLKDSTSEELFRAIREAAAGRHYLSSSLSEQVIEGYLKGPEAARGDSYDRLTAREREVLHLAAQGHTSAEIAERLFISRRTVEIHRANLRRKLGLHNQTQLLRYAFQRGILPPEPAMAPAGALFSSGS